MASLIPAGSASGTGSITLAAPVTNSNQTATLPDATGTVMVSGNMPAFSAYLSADQTVTSGVWTKVACNTKSFDTANAFDSTTNYRFTPLVAGYYQVNVAGSNGNSTGYTSFSTAIYKSGSVWQYGGYVQVSSIISQTQTSLVYCNGSTDYIEFYVYVTATTTAKISGGSSSTWFSASLVRAA